jgi:hypothetical protein
VSTPLTAATQPAPATPGAPGLPATSVPPAPTTRPGATPRRYRIFQLVVLGLAVAVASLAALAASSGSAALDAASGQVGPYVAAGRAETLLWQAHAAAAAAVLDPAVATHAERAVGLQADAADALLGLAAQAGTSPELVAAQSALLGYTGLAGHALNLPAAQAGPALKAAADQLTGEAVPALETLRAAHADAAHTDAAPGWSVALSILAALAVVALVAMSWSVALSSHRVVNLGLAVAIVAFAIIVPTAGNVGTGTGTPAFDPLRQVSTGRIAIAHANAAQLQGAADRSWAPADASAVADLLDTAASTGELRSGPVVPVKTVTTVVQATGTLLTAGDFDAAAKALTGSAAGDQASVVAGFDASAATAVDTAAADFVGALRSPSTGAVLAAWVFAGLALLAAVAGYLGLGRRLREYR